MFCGKCGSVLPDGVKFCPDCGSPVAPAEAVASAETPVQSIPYSAPVQNVNAGVYQQPPVNQYPAYAPVQTGKKQKKAKTGKKSKAPLIVCIILAVILAIIIAAVCMWQSIARAVLGEYGFYAWREIKTVDKVIHIENFDKLFENETVTAKSSVKVSTNEDTYSKLLDGVSADVMLSFSKPESKALAVVDLKAKDEKKVTANVSLDKGKLGISIPDLTEQKFYADFGIEETNIELDYETIGTELAGIFKKVDEAHIKSNTQVDKVKFDGKKCRQVTLTVDGENASDMIADLLTAIRDDKTLIDAFDPLLETAYKAYAKTKSEEKADYSEFKNKLLTGLDNAIKEVKENFNDDNINLVISFAIDSRGYIANRKIVFTSDGETVFSVNIDSNATAKVIGVDIISEENKTDFAVIRSDSSKGVDFHIFGKSVSLSDGKEENGGSFDVMINDFAASSVNGVNVPVGNIDISVIPIYSGKANEDKTVSVDINLSNSDTYNINAKLSANELDYQLDIVSELSAVADFSAFEKPDENALTSFNDFISSMSEGIDNVVEDVVKEVDPSLLTVLSRNAQIKDCEAREKLIEDNLVKYIKTGNGGKAFKDVNDVIEKQAAYDKMFDEGHPPYCKNGNSKGVKYKITVSKDLSYEIMCQNPKCPNYGR